MNCSALNNHFKWLCLASILSVSLILNMACNTAERIPDDRLLKVSQPWVFSSDFQKALYKTDMLLYGRDLSGLTMIKKNKGSYRVVMVSEVGLKYFDLEFFTRDDSIAEHHVIGFLDRKTIVQMLEKNFSLVFMIFPEKKKERFYRDKLTKSMTKEIKFKRQKNSYVFNSAFGMVSMIYAEKSGGKRVVSADIRDHLSPQTINFNQKNLVAINFNIL